MTSINGLNSVFPKNKVFQEEIKCLGEKYFHQKLILKEWKRSTITQG